MELQVDRGVQQRVREVVVELPASAVKIIACKRQCVAEPVAVHFWGAQIIFRVVKGAVCPLNTLVMGAHSSGFACRATRRPVGLERYGGFALGSIEHMQS